MSSSTAAKEQQQQQHAYDSGIDGRCIPLSDWQTAWFINCNQIHELHLTAASERNDHEEQLAVLGEGWFRTTWKLDQWNNETTVLKTLRMEREFHAEYYELHRRDAVAMERLTWSEFVVNIYGYCGQSAINEIADFPYVGIKDLEKFNRRIRGSRSPTADKIKLQIAASIAQGVADIHSIDGTERATMVHYDLNPRNIAMFAHGRPKINDFNIAEFLKYDPATNRTCGFPNRMHLPWWRAPEEVGLEETNMLDEKVDVYALGKILFAILTTHAPHGKMKAEFMEATRASVLRGDPPELPPPFRKTTNPAHKAFIESMNRCFEKDPAKRASAQEIAHILMNALVRFVGKNQGNTATHLTA